MQESCNHNGAARNTVVSADHAHHGTNHHVAPSTRSKKKNGNTVLAKITSVTLKFSKDKCNCNCNEYETKCPTVDQSVCGCNISPTKQIQLRL
eukprot:3544995-Amphidinium_carterae.1